MAAHVQWDDPSWETLDRIFVRFPYERTQTGCLSQVDTRWITSDAVAGFYCWWISDEDRKVRLIGFSDPRSALAFKLRCC